MSIDFEHFTPLMSLIGGGLIGFAALMMMAMNGRVMGISGILAGLLKKPSSQSDLNWRLAFILGTIIGPLILIYVTGQSIEIRPVSSGITLMIAGFIVGLGTAIGSGCTSGHGICGLARLSVRSFAAVMTFMATAIMTVAIIRHLL